MVIETAPVLDLIPIETTNTVFYKFIKESKLPQANTRNFGSSFAAEGEATFEPGDLTLKPFGGEFTADRMLADERMMDGMMQVEGQINRWKRALPLDWKKLLVKGSTAANAGDIDGLEGLVLGLPSSQRINFAGQAAGKTIASASAQEIVDSINYLIDTTVGADIPTMLITNRTVLRALHAKATTTAQNEVLARMFEYSTFSMPGVGGKEMKVRMGMWSGDIPMIAIDFDSQRNEILPQTEAAGDGTGNTFSSMYAVVAGEDFVLQLQKYADGPRVSIVPQSIGASYHIEWPIGLVNFHERAIGAMRGIGI